MISLGLMYFSLSSFASVSSPTEGDSKAVMSDSHVTGSVFPFSQYEITAEKRLLTNE